PRSGYIGANDSWTNRPAPAVRAASTRCCEASRRIRSFSFHAHGRNAFEVGGMCVATLTTASCPATAARTAAASKRSTDMGRAPARSSTAASSGVRATAVTSWPVPVRRGTACFPRAPVAPATKIFMAELLDSCPARHFERVPRHVGGQGRGHQHDAAGGLLGGAGAAERVARERPPARRLGDPLHHLVARHRDHLALLLRPRHPRVDE